MSERKTISDFMVLQDSPITLNQRTLHGNILPGLRTWLFTLPNDYLVGSFRAKPILSYCVLPKPQASIQFEIGPNRFRVEAIFLGEQTYRGLFLAFPGEFLSAGENYIVLRVFDKAVISGVTLWYQREIFV